MAEPDWGRVKQLNKTIADNPLYFGTDSATADSYRGNLAANNAASQELAYLLGTGDQAGRRQADAATNAAQDGLNAVLGGAGATNAAITNMNRNARLMEGEAAKISNLAPGVLSKYGELDPIAALFGDYGKDLWSEGKSLSEQAKDVFGQGEALVKMDQSAGGLAGEFVKYWQSLSPDRMVSRAASDAQSSIQNQTAQAERDLARRGVSASSGAFAGLRRTAANMAATLVASAKTRAYELGLDKQAAQLDKMVAAANTLYNMGNQTQSAATAAKNAAGDMLGKQANVISTQGEGIRSVGDLFAKAGSLLGSAGSLAGQAGSLNNQFLSLLNSAYGRLASTNLEAASLAQRARGNGGALASTSTGRHYGVGGELLETGNPKVDAELQMWRDSQEN